MSPMRLPTGAVMFAAGNIAYGTVCILDPQRTTGSSYVPGPIGIWGGLFILVGVLIFWGAAQTKWLAVGSSVAVMIWTAWAVFNLEAHLAHPNLVSWRGVVLLLWLAFLHTRVTAASTNGR